MTTVRRDRNGMKGDDLGRMLKKVVSKAAASEEPRHTFFGMLRLQAMRERC